LPKRLGDTNGVQNPRISRREIPCVRLSDAARTNPTLLRLVNDHDTRLVLVNKVLEVGRVRCEFSGRPESAYHLFVLTMGLGNYGSAAVPGAPDSALHVANRLSPFVRSKGGAVKSLVSPPDSGSPSLTREAIIGENSLVCRQQQVSRRRLRVSVFHLLLRRAWPLGGNTTGSFYSTRRLYQEGLMSRLSTQRIASAT
jgi:hypothetical protein